MNLVSFVILHYMDYNTTFYCIDSILNNINYNNYRIVIVDNGSPNNSAKQLEETFKENKKIIVLYANANLGFARGNNIGYEYSKNKLGADYIIITNNDTIFEQRDFIQTMIDECSQSDFYVVGPDLILPNGSHQNPHRDHILSKNEVKKMLFIKSLFLYYFKLKKLLHIDSKLQLLEKIYEEKDLKTQKRKSQNHQIKKCNVVLQGACLIFTPQYIKCEQEAFLPETFMYGEEDLLAYKCQKKGYDIAYIPKLYVLHMQGQATAKTYKVQLEKNIFMYTHIVKGCKLLLNLMREQ